MSNELHFSETHEWVKQMDETAVIGITDYAQHELGDIVFLEILKKSGEQIQSKEAMSTIESVKAVSEIYSPVSGQVLEINQKVIDKPELINTSPFADGWIIKVQLSNKDEVKELLDESAYNKLIAEQG
ncbi:MAG TPA: glycine cleavage system protein GcvH [Spirochaetes bacterium]|nr:glycine cleavage system protein GcvH [Spirochaetota bacterium]